MFRFQRRSRFHIDRFNMQALEEVPLSFIGLTDKPCQGDGLCPVAIGGSVEDGTHLRRAAER